MSTHTDGNEYIDLNDALKRLGGNINLYKQLLKRFDGNSYITSIVEALQTGDKTKAAHSAHALKGVSGNLAFGKLKLLSFELEKIIESGADYTACLADMKDALRATDEHIAEIIG